MPKILESVREQLLETARAQIERNGYASTTIRSVAAECGIAVGTVYNYFPSKDMLIATYVSEDWLSCLASIRAGEDDDAQTRLRHIYEALRAFLDAHAALFTDPDAAKPYHSVFAQRHGQLRAQLAALVAPICPPGADAFLPSFIAESLLTWTMEGTAFEPVYHVLQKLL